MKLTHGFTLAAFALLAHWCRVGQARVPRPTSTSRCGRRCPAADATVAAAPESIDLFFSQEPQVASHLD